MENINEIDRNKFGEHNIEKEEDKEEKEYKNSPYIIDNVNYVLKYYSEIFNEVDEFSDILTKDGRIRIEKGDVVNNYLQRKLNTNEDIVRVVEKVEDISRWSKKRVERIKIKDKYDLPPKSIIFLVRIFTELFGDKFYIIRPSILDKVVGYEVDKHRYNNIKLLLVHKESGATLGIDIKRPDSMMRGRGIDKIDYSQRIRKTGGYYLQEGLVIDKQSGKFKIGEVPNVPLVLINITDSKIVQFLKAVYFLKRVGVRDKIIKFLTDNNLLEEDENEISDDKVNEILNNIINSVKEEIHKQVIKCLEDWNKELPENNLKKNVSDLLEKITQQEKKLLSLKDIIRYLNTEVSSGWEMHENQKDTILNKECNVSITFYKSYDEWKKRLKLGYMSSRLFPPGKKKSIEIINIPLLFGITEDELKNIISEIIEVMKREGSMESKYNQIMKYIRNSEGIKGIIEKYEKSQESSENSTKG